MAKPFSDEEIKGFNKAYEDINELLSGMTADEIEVHRRFLATIAADRDSLAADKEIMVELDKINTAKSKRIAESEEKIRNLESDLQDYKYFVKQRNERIAELEKIVRDQPELHDYDALLLVRHTLEAECKRLRDELAECFPGGNTDQTQGVPITVNWEKARALYKKLMRPKEGENPCEK